MSLLSLDIILIISKVYDDNCNASLFLHMPTHKAFIFMFCPWSELNDAKPLSFWFIQLQICVVNIMEAATSRLIAPSLRSMWNALVNRATMEMAPFALPSTPVLRKLMVAAVTLQTAFSLDLWVNMICWHFYKLILGY